MTKFLISTLVSVLVVVLANPTNGVELDFALGDLEPWGEVTLNEGKRVELRCIATDAQSTGTFEWMVGGELQKSDRPIRDMGNGVYEQSLEINTAFALDKKEVECRYDDMTTGAHEDTVLTINVIHQKWPPQPFSAGEFDEGDTVALTVPFELYPAPASEDLVWKITDKSDQVTEVELGKSDATKRFKAQELKKSKGDHQYEATLKIDSVTKNDAASSIQLVVQTDPKNPSHNIDVTFSLRLKGEEPDVQQASTMGVGVWIIVAIIVLIAAIIIGYCVYQKKCAKGAGTANNESHEGYQPPKDQREVENQA